MVDRNVIWDRLGAFTGVIFAVLMVVGIGTSGSADAEPSDPSAQIAREFF